MARLPSQLTYNDLNGREATEILVDWFRQLLSQQPVLQPHLTLPMAKMTLDIHVAVDMYVGGSVPVASPPERLDIVGAVSLSNDLSGMNAVAPRSERSEDKGLQHIEQDLSATVNAAPIPGGNPPDKVREQHSLPVSRPGYGPRDTGSHLFLSDVADVPSKSPGLLDAIVSDSSGGRTGIVAEGYQFSNEPGSGPTVSPVREQVIDLPNGAIQIDLAGVGIHHAGMTVKDDSHRASVKKFGDNRGERRSSVNGVYDAGPAGLMSGGGNRGLGGDGRPRMSGDSFRKG